MKSVRTFLFIPLALIVLFGFSTEAFAADIVTTHPARTSLTLTQPQQFTAVVANSADQSVAWFVDGRRGGDPIVGTISSTGLYQPSPSRGTHTITAWSLARAEANGSATVWVTDYPGMLTYHADRFRSGVNLQEFALTSATLNAGTFGKLFSRPVDGQIYAQPLHVANLTIAGARHNVVYLVTEHASVY